MWWLICAGDTVPWIGGLFRQPQSVSSGPVRGIIDIDPLLRAGQGRVWVAEWAPVVKETN